VAWAGRDPKGHAPDRAPVALRLIDVIASPTWSGSRGSRPRSRTSSPPACCGSSRCGPRGPRSAAPPRAGAPVRAGHNW